MKRVALHLTEAKRIDVALAKALDISRAKAQKLIADGAILVDGLVPNGHQMVENANVVTIDESKRVAPVVEANAPTLPLDIIYEDADVLVINKPAGILVHPTSASTEVTMVDALKAHIPNLKAIGDDKARSGIVHRLDKDASGVMIVAKTTEAFAHLKKQFAGRANEKHYTVLVMGSVVDDSGTITFPIARSKTKARMAARPHSQDGKDAITHFDVVQRYTNCTLMDVRIETGRTHQIRAHFYALGHPVAGDKLYVKKGVKQIPLGRLFLHARALTITLPNGERTTFEAPLPALLQSTLHSLTPTTKRFLAGIGATAPTTE
jgi:23S rRNA pseudouridine1911/1915/1917 synthase